MKKSLSRVKIILSGGLFRIVGSFSNLIISLFIIRTHSAEFWGEIIPFILFVDFGFAIVNWGHSHYLVREFSLHPQKIQDSFLKAFISRTLLLAIFIVVAFFTTQELEFWPITVWCVARFIYQSFDPITLFERNFKFSITLELAGVLIIILPITFSIVMPTVCNMLFLYGISFAFRAFVAATYYNNFFSNWKNIMIPVAKDFFIPASSFFLLTVSAMIQQRADLYTVAYFLPSTETAKYQVLLNLLIFNQMAASFILSPFAKNIFRLSQQALNKLEAKFITSGVILSILSTTFIYIVITTAYKLQFHWTMYLMGYFYILCFYCYQIKNYELGKKNKQRVVAFYSIAGCCINILVSLILTPKFGIEGALMAGLITQLFLTILYRKDQLLKLANANR